MSIETIVDDLKRLTGSLDGDDGRNLRISLGFCEQKIKLQLFRSASIDFYTILAMDMSHDTREKIVAIATELFTEHTCPPKLPRS
jgi:hypothetical protein